MTKQLVSLSRPKDKSLEAFKAWMEEFFTRMGVKDKGDPITEEEWTETWKEFWAKAPPEE